MSVGTTRQWWGIVETPQESPITPKYQQEELMPARSPEGAPVPDVYPHGAPVPARHPLSRKVKIPENMRLYLT